MKKPKIKRGKQHRTKFMEKHYVALLKKHGRLTVKQLFQMTRECKFTARRRLVEMMKSGKINGEIIGNSLEFWICDEQKKDKLMKYIGYGRAEVKSTVFITPTSTRMIDEINTTT